MTRLNKKVQNFIYHLRKRKTNEFVPYRRITNPVHFALIKSGVLAEDGKKIVINRRKLNSVKTREVIAHMPQKKVSGEARVDRNVVYSFLESLAVRSARISGVVKPSRAVPAKQIVDLCNGIRNQDPSNAVASIAPTIDQFLTNIESGVFGIAHPIKES